ncbi:MAG: DNA-directed RNA polymerase subunit beta' [Patescibacteria group bacterium]
MTAHTYHSMDFDAIRLRLASPEVIRKWSHGEVSRPETINYRTQKPEKGGLFAEEIFGPTKDWECYCGKYKKIRYKGIVCDKCGVEVTHSLVRRERMGHIELAAPVAHIWFLRSVPSKIGTVLDLSVQSIERVIYFASFIITQVNRELQQQTLEQLRNEYKSKRRQIKNEFEKDGESLGAKAEQAMNKKLKELEEDFVHTEREINEIQPLHIVGENQYQEMSLRFGHFFEAGIGAEAIVELLEKMDVEKTIQELEQGLVTAKGAKRERLVRRLKLLRSLKRNGIKPSWMVMRAVPVIPPDLRPMVALDGGRFATSDLNDLYRRVINRNNRLKRLLELNAPEVIVRNEKRMLQEASDALIDNNARRTKTVAAATGQRRQLRSLADILKGKQGRFRQNLLGKRVDYSGRSVIVVGPNLNLDECGIPKRMALELFKPMVMSKIIKRELAHNVRSAARFVEGESDVVWDILEEVIAGTRVLLNRAPTLHRLGVQAFRPRLIEGKAIRIHPLVCTAFNADFDGDQMAVHVPLTEEARLEAENLMASDKNLLKPATGDPVVTPKQDLALGCFYVTQMAESTSGTVKAFYSPKEALMAYKVRKIGLQEKILVRFEDFAKFEPGQGPRIETTVGRVMFNAIFPDKLPYYNESIISKKLAKIIRLILEFYGEAGAARVLDELKNLGFKYVTKAGYSLGMDDFPYLTDKAEVLKKSEAAIEEASAQYAEGLLTQNERHTKIIEIWTDAKKRILAMSKEALNPRGPVFAMIESGARGSWDQLTQVIGMKGLVASPSGEIIELPVKGSFKEGFGVLEFFISSHGTRKGLTDTALRTANAGYLTRRLVDVAQDVTVMEEDCGEDAGIEITKAESQSMGEKLADRVVGRFAVGDVKVGRKKLVRDGALITEAIAREIEKADLETIRVRSVLLCKMPKGICQKCYGYDLGHNRLVEIGTAAGIVAAQAIGEPGTQLTMRTFHTGGVAGTDITKGLPRVEELFEARPPKRKAFLAEVSGTVKIESAEGRVIEAGGKKIFEGRSGQKVVRIEADPLTPERITLTEKDEVVVGDGQEVAVGDVLLVRGSGDKEYAKYPGTVSVAKKSLKVEPRGMQVKEYIVPIGYKMYMKDGEHVGAGDPLTDGYIHLQELHDLKGKEAVQKYILREIQDIYSSQGQKLNDKHVEIIIRQMFSRVYIEDAGDTDLLPGETVEKAQLMEANRIARKEKLQPAKGRELFLGVSRVSLSTQSFLSSASFQETARVLINAAVTGKIDYLEGLKENVIIGRQIPAGTGFARK